MINPFENKKIVKKTRTIITQRFWFDVDIDVTDVEDIKKLVERVRRCIGFETAIPIEVKDDTLIIQSERILANRSYTE